MIEELYRTYSRSVYRVCLRYTGNRMDAEEVTHDVFLKVADSIGGFGNRSAVFTWIYRIAVNESLQFIRRRKRENWHNDGTLPDTLPGVQAEKALELRMTIREILARFDDRTQRIVAMLYVDGLTQEQAAAAEGISRAALNKRLVQLRKKTEGLKKQWTI